MNSYFLLIIGAAIIPNLVQCFSVTTNVTATTPRLWTLDDSSTDFTNKVYKELKNYAEYCCTKVHKKSSSKCQTLQMGYWGMILDSITSENDRMKALRDDFDPSKNGLNTDTINKMCDCNGNYNTADERCDPIKKESNYPYFSFPTAVTPGGPKTHTEQRLLPIIKNKAKEYSNDNQKSTFYLYSYNSPCSCDFNQQDSCLFMYNNQNINDARSLFCQQVDIQKISYSAIESKDGLELRKTYKEPGKGNIKSDQQFYNELEPTAC